MLIVVKVLIELIGIELLALVGTPQGRVASEPSRGALKGDQVPIELIVVIELEDAPRSVPGHRGRV